MNNIIIKLLLIVTFIVGSLLSFGQAPTTQDSNLQFSGFDSNSMTITWAVGNGTSRVVYLNTSNVFTNPTNGTTPSMNSTWAGTGQQAIYVGSGSGVHITGLVTNTTYYARVYAFNGTGTGVVYNTTSSTANVTFGQGSPAQLLNMQSTVSTNASVLVKATVTATPPSITLKYSATNGTATGWTIYRKLKSSTTWGSAIASLSGGVLQYTDNSVSTNVYYEYKVQKGSGTGASSVCGYIATGIQLDPIDYRGKMILLVDQTFTPTLTNELNQLVQDLKGDGWVVLRTDLARTSSISTVKDIIASQYNSDPTNVKAVYIVGHLAVPYSGKMAPDGHTEFNCDHIGAWSSDGYYAELTGGWTDNTVTQNCGDVLRNRNIPGDGKFDQNVFPSSVELQIGRIDVHDMSSYLDSEVTPMRNYLNKAHEWKIKKYTSPERAVVNDGFTTNYKFAENGWRNFGPLVGSTNILPFVGPVAPFPFQTQTSTLGQLWSITTNGGLKTSPSGGLDAFKYDGTFADYSSTGAYANPATPFNSVFNIVTCSYAGDWDGTNGFLKGIVMSGKALTAVWAIPNWFFHHMGMGDNIGYGVRTTMNNFSPQTIYDPYYATVFGPSGNNTFTHLGLIGDPSLRTKYVEVPKNLTITNNGTSLTFNWSSASDDKVVGYHIYKINPNSAPTRITTSPVNATTTTIPIGGSVDGQVGTEYMIRAIRLETSFSGSYYNSSIGISTTVPSSATGVRVAIKVLLQGAYSSSGLMYDSLRIKSFLPSIDPYPLLGYSYVGGTSLTATNILASNGNSSIVDWVVVELRSSVNPSNKIYTRPALLQKDGDVVDMDGTSSLLIPVQSGAYYVAIHHRNHLGVMTASALNLTSTNTTIDFTNTSTATFGTNGQYIIAPTINGLWMGDININKVIMYSGTDNDRDLILSRIGGIIPTQIVNGYYSEDVNLDGVVKYTGVTNDRDYILFNIGGIVPTNTKLSQVP